MQTQPILHRSIVSILSLCLTGLGCGGDGATGSRADKGGEPSKSAPAKSAPAKPATPPAAAADPHAAHRAAAGTAMPPPDPAPGGDGYDLELRIDPAPAAGAKSRMIFDPRTQTGERVPKLAIAHEKLLHFLFVSRDLSFFAHEHPEIQPDGTLMLDLVFPPAGEYLAFADFTPEGGTQQIVRKPVSVAGDAPAAKPLIVDDRTKPKAFGAREVTLGPKVVTAGGGGAMLEFAIRSGDAPVKDLRPYLGAMGHCVIVSEDTTEFLHSHPQEEQGPQAHIVTFHTVFPKAGKYKVWGQFDVGGEMLIADFVLDVGEQDQAGTAAADPHAGH